MNDSALAFVGNERCFASNVAEAILLSPTIHQLIQADLTMQEIVIQGEWITADDSSTFLNCVRGF
jgi:hypothetical protein